MYSKCLHVLSHLNPLGLWFCYHTTAFKIQISKTPCHRKSAIHMRLSQTIPRYKTATFFDPDQEEVKTRKQGMVKFKHEVSLKCKVSFPWSRHKKHPHRLEVVPFFFIFSLRSMVNGQLDGFSFSTQNSPAIPNTGYNQFNTVSQQGYCRSSPRGHNGCCKHHEKECKLLIWNFHYQIKHRHVKLLLKCIFNLTRAMQVKCKWTM